MVNGQKCHEDAYWPKILSVFAFNLLGHWAKIKKSIEENSSQMFLLMSLQSQRMSCFCTGCPKSAKKSPFFTTSSSGNNNLEIKTFDFEFSVITFFIWPK